ncbi:hypothetical protein TPHA_0D02030 [Tetrapisispora phaffii CBS 4417]|uniref:Uncharacterized protein n=1 Tax=Tetrapisispora phaffii (strain ATCC 24235 / CBS 4417 / NBRC 1672 / NRRL Y-8282 / UCD 70-5) TaxID=1071381 RepID=G8BSM0_TETPH|nr:hypothetical protein TPHA_0D02030 [Tetrapisispora phaffii CBS 4417]CCE62841.1 hypothetical protein TPHA_0D02030 [Tetrapisispora phaffii CBS 4417]
MSDVISVIKRQSGLKYASIDNDEMENFSSDEDVPMVDIDGKSNGGKRNEAAAGEIVTPGELITEDPIWMRGHGTYFLENSTYSSAAGTISRVNRLLSVIPLKGRYTPETGDHIVGRITDVGNKRWKVDIGGKQHAVLMLGSVNLPGGILRRKSESDELQMRTFLKEGDVLNAEVQSLFQDGSASLHTRSLKYGKLRDGLLIQVPSSLVVRSKNHTHNLPGNVTVLLGVNGFIWLRKTSKMDVARETPSAGPASDISEGPTGAKSLNPTNSVSITRLEEESSWKIYSDKNDPSITPSIRQNISRYANVIKALAFCEIGLTHERIVIGYEASIAYSNIGELIEREVMESIGDDVINIEKMRGNGATE